MGLAKKLICSLAVVVDALQLFKDPLGGREDLGRSG